MPIVVLISGGGTNLQAIIDAAASGELPVTIEAVVSDKPNAYGLERAQKAGIKTLTLEYKGFESREAYDVALQQLIEAQSPQLVVLAGFMRILSAPFVEHFLGRMINIHPSLLPKHRGLNTHQRAIDAGDGEAGCTVHFVVPEIDAGPMIIQARVPIHDGDSSDELAARVLKQEHQIFTRAIDWFANSRLRLVDGDAQLDGKNIEI
ncbi:MAG: phosphoribosylglycinamide formyltransferase [Gammaproteobacteria bacterium]|nr:phosphoribosylglycinamide formyltransferase [Gammaproteobacteria bacterium]MCW8888709.1 phosphoribosylglycinamide formyltransferase [Gammaproteobacteria bacterium]MCW8983067.1 phosphoribosylglycinamide formyltransferase [Gammaproteobacteria bacterium]